MPPEFTARQFLAYMAAMKGLPSQVGARRADEILVTAGLHRAADQRLATLSGGMKQRVGIAQALLNDPRVLVVDEPTAGLDPEERVQYRNLFSSLAADRLVILSTHIITDVETIASRLVLFKHGRVVEDTTPAALLEQVGGKVWRVTTDPATAQYLQRSYRVSHVSHTSNGIALRLLSSTRPADTAASVEATLEEAYILRTSE